MASAKERLKATIRRAANTLGYDIVGYDGENGRTRLARLLHHHRVSLVLDVGANHGHFGWDMRELGYRGRIVSFEPLSDAFQHLHALAASDSAWQAVNIGLGDRNEECLLNVAANSQSSSLLPMLEAHAEAAPESRYETQERVIIRSLDSVFGDYCAPNDVVFLKIDTQGFEKNVLDGASGMLDAAPLVQLECSLVPLYEGANLIEDMISYMRGLGYDPIDLSPAFFHRDSSHLMQADILFLRPKK